MRGGDFLVPIDYDLISHGEIFCFFFFECVTLR